MSRGLPTRDGANLVCLYGGTFDPPHRGHVEAARAVVHAVAPRELVIAVAEAPAYRDAPERTAHERRILARAAFLGLAGEARLYGTRVNVSDIERKLTARTHRPVRTIDVVRELSARRPGRRIAVAIGADQLAAIRSWDSWRELLSEAELIVVPRPDVVSEGDLIAAVADLEAEVSHATIACIPMPRVDVSSTEVREGIRLQGVGSVADRVPSRVLTLLERQ